MDNSGSTKVRLYGYQWFHNDLALSITVVPQRSVFIGNWFTKVRLYGYQWIHNDLALSITWLNKGQALLVTGSTKVRIYGYQWFRNDLALSRTVVPQRSGFMDINGSTMFWLYQ